MRPSLPLVCAIVSATGCVNTTYPTVHGGTFAAIRARAPLLADEHLLDPPAKDASLLGRILPEPYDPARPLAGQLAPPDGETNEHYLTKSQTRRFVERYNRAIRGEK